MSDQQAPTSDQARTAWDGLAAGFDRFVTPQAATLAEAVLRRLDVHQGTRLLDVAAGSGALSIPAARMGAEVVATDIAPGMIERLNIRALKEGLALQAAAMDGEALDLGDGSFDVAVSVNGVSLFGDIARGLAELTRVTRSGGRVVIVGFGPLPKTEFIAFFMKAMQATVPGFAPLPADPPPLPFQVADPEVLRRRLTEAGLVDTHVDTVTWEMEIGSGEHFWQVFTSSNPTGAQLVERLTAEQRVQVKQVLAGMLRERSGGSPGAVLRAEMNIGIGTVPEK